MPDAPTDPPEDTVPDPPASDLPAPDGPDGPDGSVEAERPASPDAPYLPPPAQPVLPAVVVPMSAPPPESAAPPGRSAPAPSAAPPPGTPPADPRSNPDLVRTWEQRRAQARRRRRKGQAVTAVLLGIVGVAGFYGVQAVRRAVQGQGCTVDAVADLDRTESFAEVAASGVVPDSSVSTFVVRSDLSGDALATGTRYTWNADDSYFVLRDGDGGTLGYQAFAQGDDRYHYAYGADGQLRRTPRTDASRAAAVDVPLAGPILGTIAFPELLEEFAITTSEVAVEVDGEEVAGTQWVVDLDGACDDDADGVGDWLALWLDPALDDAAFVDPDGWEPSPYADEFPAVARSLFTSAIDPTVESTVEPAVEARLEDLPELDDHEAFVWVSVRSDGWVDRLHVRVPALDASVDYRFDGFAEEPVPFGGIPTWWEDT